MASLLLDEDVPVALRHRLAAKGHIVVMARSLSANKAGDRIEDDRLLEEAIKIRHALVTFNWDFHALHERRRGHFGIVILRHLRLPRGRDPNDEIAKILDEFCRRQGTLNGQRAVMKCLEGVDQIVVE